MKTALKMLAAFLGLDVLVLSYFSVFSKGYEEAFAAFLYGALFGLPALGAFVALLIVYLRQRKGN